MCVYERERLRRIFCFHLQVFGLNCRPGGEQQCGREQRGSGQWLFKHRYTATEQHGRGNQAGNEDTVRKDWRVEVKEGNCRGVNEEGAGAQSCKRSSAAIPEEYGAQRIG